MSALKDRPPQDPLAAHKPLSAVIMALAPILLIATVALYLFSLNTHWKFEWDSAYYLMLAKSILTGKGYTYLGHPALKTPFGFPLLISPFVLFSGANFVWLNGAMLVTAMLAVAAVFLLFRALFSPGYAVLIAFFTAWSALMLDRAGFIMIDVPYMALSVLALFFIQRFIRGNRSFARGSIAVAAIIAAFYFRIIGVALIAGTLVYLFLHARSVLTAKRFYALALILIIPVSAWVWYAGACPIDREDPLWQLTEFIPSKLEGKRLEHNDPASKINGPADFMSRGLKNLAYYGGVSCSVLTGVPLDTSLENLKKMPWVFRGLLLTLVLVMIGGFLYSILRHKFLFDYYVVFYFGVLFTWSAREPRYLLPVLPFLLHYLLTGLTVLVRQVQTRLVRPLRQEAGPAAGALMIYGCCFLAANTFQDIGLLRQQHANPYYSDAILHFFKATDWVKNNTPSDCRIVSVNAPVAANFCGRWCVSFPWVKNPKVILDFLYKINAGYLIVSPLIHQEQRFLNTVIDKNGPIFEKMFSSGEAFVYRIDRDRLVRQIALKDRIGTDRI